VAGLSVTGPFLPETGRLRSSSTRHKEVAIPTARHCPATFRVRALAERGHLPDEVADHLFFLLNGSMYFHVSFSISKAGHGLMRSGEEGGSADQGRTEMVVVNTQERRGGADEWSEGDKAEWLAEHAVPTHIVSFRPMLTLEVSVPPWESAQVRTSRAAVEWGTRVRDALRDAGIPGVKVVAVHCEDSTHWTAPIAGMATRVELA
jgi:hypothetical protein